MCVCLAHVAIDSCYTWSDGHVYVSLLFRAGVSLAVPHSALRLSPPSLTHSHARQARTPPATTHSCEAGALPSTQSCLPQTRTSCTAPMVPVGRSTHSDSWAAAATPGASSLRRTRRPSSADLLPSSPRRSGPPGRRAVPETSALRPPAGETAGQRSKSLVSAVAPLGASAPPETRVAAATYWA